MTNNTISSRYRCKFSLLRTTLVSQLAAWCSGNMLNEINEVTLRRAGLVLGWVTVCSMEPAN